MKLCKWCNTEKDISMFYSHPQMKDGHLNKCKECQKKNSSLAREKNRDYYLAYDRDRSNLPHRKLLRDKYANTEAGKEAARLSRERWLRENKLRRAAEIILGNAIRDKRIERLPCFVCGSSEVHGHHPDYDNPLEVVWLCPKHHSETHLLYRRITNNGRGKSINKNDYSIKNDGSRKFVSKIS